MCFSVYNVNILINQKTMQEEWRDFPNFLIPGSNQAMFKISNIWRVKSFRNTESKIVPSYIQTAWYRYFQFTVFGKRHSFLIHRAVMMAFHGVSDLVVNHIDGDKTNNTLENLEYCTQQENARHAVDTWLKIPLKGEAHPHFNKTWKNHPKSKAVLQKNDAFEVVKIWDSMMQAEKELGWKRSAISRACRMNRKAYWHYWEKQ